MKHAAKQDTVEDGTSGLPKTTNTGLLQVVWCPQGHLEGLKSGQGDGSLAGLGFLQEPAVLMLNCSSKQEGSAFNMHRTC